MKLSELKPGEKGRILKVEGENPTVKRRLRDMGLIRGEKVIVERVAPLGDPIDVKVKGYSLSLRRGEADLIQVEKL
jgi:Fe2+ transport system protein FeoA